MNSEAREKKSRGGRHPKFAEPRRPVTVTLPERILRRLAEVDRDRAHAIVRLAEHRCFREETGSRGVEIVEVVPGSGIILVGPMRSLGRMELLRFVEVAPNRYLLSIPSGTAVESLEMEMIDILESLPAEDEPERPELEKLRWIINRQRKQKTVSKREFLLIGT